MSVETTQPVLEQILASLQRIEEKLGIANNSSGRREEAAGREEAAPSKNAAPSKDAVPASQTTASISSSIKPHPTPAPNDVIKNFLNQRGIQIQSLPTADAADPTLDKLAHRIGQNHPILRSSLSSLKYAIQEGRGISEKVDKRSQTEVGTLTQIFSDLHRLAFLEDYHYARAPRFVINARPSRLPRAINFFNGGWLERWLRLEVQNCHCQVFASQPGDWNLTITNNPQVTFSNGDHFEMDLFISIGSKAVFWFEAKSGDYQRHIAKYSRLAKKLGLEIDQAFMILPDIQESDSEPLKALFGMNVVNLVTLKEQLTLSFQNHLRLNPVKTEPSLPQIIPSTFERP